MINIYFHYIMIFGHQIIFRVPSLTFSTVMRLTLTPRISRFVTAPNSNVTEFKFATPKM